MIRDQSSSNSSAPDTANPGSVVQIDPKLVAGLDQAAILGDFANRDAFVNAMLTNFLNDLKRSNEDAVYSSSIWSDEMLGPSNAGQINLGQYHNADDHHYTFEVALRQVGFSTDPHKRVFISRFVRGSENRRTSFHELSFSAAVLPWVRQFLMPWLTSALEQAEIAHHDEISAKRLRDQAEREAITPAQKAADTEARRVYTELYGAAKWKYAVAQASRHRERAELRGRTEHFKAVEWLKLASESKFRCTECGANAPLQTHHIQEISKGGANTIENIQLICKTCHVTIAMAIDRGQEWYDHELLELARFKVGDPVTRSAARSIRSAEKGLVLAVTGPQKGERPYWCHRSYFSTITGERVLSQTDAICRIFRNDHVTGYEPTRVRVLWAGKKDGKQKEEDVVANALTVCPVAGR